MQKKLIFADNAGTTSISPAVFEEMKPHFTQIFGNPSSLHPIGEEAKEILDSARTVVANCLGASAREIFFTGSGSESINWAVKGTAQAAKRQNPDKNHIISTQFEHHATLHALESLEKDGFEVTLLKPNRDGIISAEQVVNAIKEQTCLVCIMAVNNEIGTIQPIKEIANAVNRKDPKLPIFTDAVQAVGNIPVNVRDWGVDLLAMSGHKIHAPKGIGVLYIKKGTKVRNLIDGGGQENGRRGGTENLPYIVGLAKALEIATAKLPELERVREMRDRIIDALTALPHTKLNGSLTQRVAGNANISFFGAEGESLLLDLGFAGICVSTGSACAAKDLTPSHVLLSIGVPIEWAHCSLRITLGHDNTEQEANEIINAVKTAVQRIRGISTLASR